MIKLTQEQILMLHTELISANASTSFSLEYTQKELYTTVLNVASGKADVEELTTWILNHQT